MNSQSATHRIHQSKDQPGNRRQEAARKPANDWANRDLAACERAILDPAAARPQDILSLQDIAGNQAVSGLIQAKLRVGPAGDAYEQQADRVAESVVEHNPGRSSPASQAAAIQRPAALEAAPQPEAPASQPGMKSGFAAGAKTEQRLQGLRGNGQPLPGELRKEMEMHLGADFSEVRLHTNSEAGRLNRQMAARAFTHGKDIYLDSGEYNPATREGKRLLAHELTHVVQQTGKRPPAATSHSVEALGKSHGLAAGSPGAARAGAQAGVVQRYYETELKNEEGGDSYTSALPEGDKEKKEGEQEADVQPQAAPVEGSKRKYPYSRTAIDLTNLGKGRPEPLKLPEKYKDEEKKSGWRAFLNQKPGESEAQTQKRQRISEKTSLVTRHFTDAERDQNELKATTPDVEKRIYAMNPAGRAVTGIGQQYTQGPGGKKLSEHHSTMFAGADVAHAGHIGVKQGKVNYLDDDSGHYRPTAAHTWDAFSRLLAGGKLAQSGKVSMVDKTKEKGVSAGYGENKLELPFYAYRQTHGNEEQARNKEGMLGEMAQWWRDPSKALKKTMPGGEKAPSDYKASIERARKAADERTDEFNPQKEDTGYVQTPANFEDFLAEDQDSDVKSDSDSSGHTPDAGYVDEDGKKVLDEAPQQTPDAGYVDEDGKKVSDEAPQSTPDAGYVNEDGERIPEETAQSTPDAGYVDQRGEKIPD